MADTDPTIGVVGAGLIGTSLALALKDNDPEQRILGYDSNETHAQQAMRRGAYDDFKATPAELAECCDIIVIATPVGVVRSVLAQLKDFADDIIITDVGSVKGSVITDARSVWGKMPARMIPAHPIAGGEESGPTAADKDLFRSRYVFLTPEPQSDIDALSKVLEMWQKVGAKVETLSPTEHDELFATTSHLPHIVAYALINALEHSNVNTTFSAGGLKDFTRIAASDPTMWRDICMANSDYILKSIKTFEGSIATIREMIENKEHTRLLELLKQTAAEKGKLNLKD